MLGTLQDLGDLILTNCPQQSYEVGTISISKLRGTSWGSDKLSSLHDVMHLVKQLNNEIKKENKKLSPDIVKKRNTKSSKFYIQDTSILPLSTERL